MEARTKLLVLFGLSCFLTICSSMFAYVAAARTARLGHMSGFLILFLLFLLASCTTTIIGAHLARSICAPLRDLCTATNKLSRGNFDAQVQFHGTEELGELSTVFNKMVSMMKNANAERAQLDKAKTEFLSISGHELRSPMTAMKAHMQMLLKGYRGKLTKKQKETLEIVLNNTMRLDKIIVDFLDISRIESARLKFSFEQTDLKRAIRSIVKETASFWPEKDIDIVTKIDHLPIIEVDPDRLMQVFRNILNNAMKFSPPKSTIYVEGKVRKQDILFSIRDEGVGIDKTNQHRIFEPFFQEEQTMYRKYRGTGLGLTICRGIIETQQGSLWVESEREKGSTFFFTVPLTPINEIKPIKVMFSYNQTMEDKLLNMFREKLGPLGDAEFHSLKDNNRLTRTGVKDRVDLLVEKGVLDNRTGRELEQMSALVLEKRRTAEAS